VKPYLTSLSYARVHFDVDNVSNRTDAFDLISDTKME
jgi:hypothetical protein